ncbi:hypothetical protein CR513_35051, partial [Mucuna pruriens]
MTPSVFMPCIEGNASFKPSKGHLSPSRRVLAQEKLSWLDRLLPKPADSVVQQPKEEQSDPINWQPKCNTTSAVSSSAATSLLGKLAAQERSLEG